MRWFLQFIMILVCLSTVGVVLGQDVETFVTNGGMSVTYPSIFTASTDGVGDYSLNLSGFSEAGIETVRVVGQDDLTSSFGDAELNSADDVLEEYRRTMFGTFDSTLVQDVTLTNGRALVQPYESFMGQAVFIALETSVGELAFLEVIVLGEDANPMEDVQAYLDIAASIAFGAEPTNTALVDDSTTLPTLDLPRGELTPDEMPEGTIILSTNVQLPLPDDWQPADSNAVFDAVTLNFRGMGAYAAITTADTTGFVSFADWRDSLLGFLGGMMLGTEDGSIPEPVLIERADGRAAERYSGVEDRIIMYWVDLGGGLGMMIQATVLMAEESDIPTIIADLDRVAAEATRFNRNSSNERIEAECTTTISFTEGESAIFICPAGCTDGSAVWGTGVYTGDSAICAAAVHAGVISGADGGEVLASYAPGQDSYLGSTQNDVTTNDYGSWGNSLTLEAAGE